MSVVYGIPTVIGGIREGVFLSSLEQGLDSIAKYLLE